MRNGYRDLQVWQKGIELARAVYKLTDEFPDDERYGLVSQMRRAAVSIPSNIAEGSKRQSKKDFRHFLAIAYGSGAELETHLVIAKGLSFGTRLDYASVEPLLDQCMRMLNVMLRQ